MDRVALWLPWPDHLLSPNQRIHWGRLSKAKAKYRDECRCHTERLVTTEQREWLQNAGKLVLGFVFHPPTSRDYDVDNLLARMKAGIDGMCDSFQINDKLFSAKHQILGAKVSGGVVNVLIRRMDDPVVARFFAS